jgi:hypothetical protein
MYKTALQAVADEIPPHDLLMFMMGGWCCGSRDELDRGAEKESESCPKIGGKESDSSASHLACR